MSERSPRHSINSHRKEDKHEQKNLATDLCLGTGVDPVAIHSLSYRHVESGSGQDNDARRDARLVSLDPLLDGQAERNKPRGSHSVT